MIPVFINVFNRLSCLERLIKRLEEMKFQDIFLIDNGSSYPPLIEYLNLSPHRVYWLGENYGSYALWTSGLLTDFCNMNKFKGYYVYTDPDVIPIPECPDDVLLYLREVLERHPDVKKAGLGLRIDNLPKNKHSEEIITWESQYWEKKIDDNLYEAYIDTTFSMYRADGATGHAMGARTGFPYIGEHTTWYEDMNDLTGELAFYVKYLDPRWSHWFRDLKGKV